MIFDGIKFRRSYSAVRLPHAYWAGDSKSFVTFGRQCSKKTPGAIKCLSWYRSESPFKDEPEQTENGPAYPVYAKPVDCDGHSLTNLMYGKDGYMYLAYKGDVYVARWKKKKC